MSPTPDDPTQAQAWITGEAPDQTVDFYIPRGNTGPIGPRGPIGPSLAVGNVTTVVGPAAPGTVGPQGLTGPKGDPGGWTTGTELGNVNLNSIVTPGLYRAWTTTYSTVENNYPPTVGLSQGVLEVMSMAAPTDIIQRYTVMGGIAGNGKAMFIRRYFGGNWSTWTVFLGARIDQTAGRAIYTWDDVNRREQLTYGDTGLRDMTLSNSNPAFFDTNNASRKVFLRRYGSFVSVMGQLQVLAGATATNYSTFLNLPAGFRSAGGVGGVETTALQIRGGTALLRFLTSGNDLALQTLPNMGAGLGNMTAGDVINLQATWQTTDAWPTILPGTASAGIPNT